MTDSELLSHFGINLGISTLLILLTSTMHFVGLSIFTILLRADEWRQLKRGAHPLLTRYLMILIVVIGIFGLLTLEIWTYAGVYYYFFGAFSDFEEALYFSIQNFVALGYGDLFLPRAWRIVGAIEAVNGVVLLGWSTAFFITVVSRLRVLEHEWLDQFRPKQGIDDKENNS